MKNIYLLLPAFLFLVCVEVTGQSLTTKEIADKNYSDADSLTKIRSFDRAIELFQKASILYRTNKNHENYANCLIKLAQNYYQKFDWEKSYEYAQKSLRFSLTEFGENSIYAAKSYLCIGLYQQIKEKNNIALEYFHKTIKIITSNNLNNLETLIDVYNFSARSYYNKSDNEKAQKYLSLAIEASTKLHGKADPRTIRLLLNKGVIYYGSSMLEKSLNTYLSILPSLNDSSFQHRSLLISLYNNMGNTYLARGEYESALKCLMKSTTINEQLYGKNSKVSVNSLIVLSSIYIQLGKYDQAYNYLQKSKKLTLEVYDENHPLLVSYYSDMATILTSRGQYEEALEHQKKALELSVKNDIHILRSYGFLVKTLLDIQRYDEAMNTADEAFEVYLNQRFKEGTTKEEFKAKLHYQKGLIYTELKQYDSALVHLNEAAKVYELVYKTSSHANIAKVFLDIGNVHKYVGQFKSAMIYYNKALLSNTITIKNKKGEVTDFFDMQNDKLTYLDIQHEIGSLYIDQYLASQQIEHLQKALRISDEVIESIDKVRSIMLLSENKLSFLGQVSDKYEHAVYANLLMADQEKGAEYYEKAFYLVEKSKHSLIKESVDKIDATNFLNIPTELIELERKLISDQAYYKSKLVNPQNTQSTDQKMISEYEDNLFYVKKRIDSLKQELQKDYKPYFDLKYSNRAIPIADIQKELNEQSVVVEYFISESTFSVFLISRDDFEIITLDNIEEVRARIKNFQHAIENQNKEEFTNNGYQLYVQLLAPVLKRVEKKHLIIVPDKELWHLNFDLLLTELGNEKNYRELPYLLKTNEITYANSATLLFKKKREIITSSSENCLAVSYLNEEDYDAGSNSISFSNLRSGEIDLPGTRDEIKRISHIVEGRYLYGKSANEKNFVENATEYSILHLALHGEIDPRNPENSKLIFNSYQQDSLYDNTLYSHELYTLNLPAKLTVLSACNTGTGKLNTGEGIMSLGHAFQYAGTESLLLSAWEVTDMAAPILIENFYKNLADDMTKSAALRKAKIDFLSKADFDKTAPFYWGNFYLLGNSDPIKINQPTNLFFYGMLSLAIILMIILSYVILRKKKHAYDQIGWRE